MWRTLQRKCVLQLPCEGLLHHTNTHELYISCHLLAVGVVRCSDYGEKSVLICCCIVGHHEVQHCNLPYIGAFFFFYFYDIVFNPKLVERTVDKACYEITHPTNS